jgi:hypothetical protein
MRSETADRTTSRRRLLRAVATGATLSLAGCTALGGQTGPANGGDSRDGSGDTPTPTESPAPAEAGTETPTPAGSPTPTGAGETDGTGGPLPTDTGETTGETSLAGSCSAAFGDTDQQYEAASSQWVVTFAYPMGGEVAFAGAAGDEIGATIGYDPDMDGGYAHELTVVQEDGATITVAELLEEAGWESGAPVTYDGTEHPVAVRLTPDSVTMVFAVEADGVTHGIIVSATPGLAEACPDVYAAVCRRVLESVAPRE